MPRNNATYRRNERRQRALARRIQNSKFWEKAQHADILQYEDVNRSQSDVDPEDKLAKVSEELADIGMKNQRVFAYANGQTSVEGKIEIPFDPSRLVDGINKLGEAFKSMGQAARDYAAGDDMAKATARQTFRPTMT